MALDNANFISELSIVDPPGTDPLSQGDDQIRTIKRATQQSFPNIAAAVTLTDVQMNLAAIKNEANVFTAAQTVTGGDFIVLPADGTVQTHIQLQKEGGLESWKFVRQASVSTGDFVMQRFDILGDFVEVVLRCATTTGVFDFQHVPTIDGAPLWIAGELRMFIIDQGAQAGANWFLADGLNGTVNLTDRMVGQVGDNTVGTLLNAAIVGTVAADNTGSTAISQAQMPVHRHRIAEKSLSGGQVQANPATVLVAGQGVAGVILSTGTQSYADQTADARAIIENTGSGSGHTHTKAAQSLLLTDNTSKDSVRPLQATVGMYQYVP